MSYVKPGGQVEQAGGIGLQRAVAAGIGDGGEREAQPVDESGREQADAGDRGDSSADRGG